MIMPEKDGYIEFGDFDGYSTIAENVEKARRVRARGPAKESPRHQPFPSAKPTTYGRMLNNATNTYATLSDILDNEVVGINWVATSEDQIELLALAADYVVQAEKFENLPLNNPDKIKIPDWERIFDRTIEAIKTDVATAQIIRRTDSHGRVCVYSIDPSGQLVKDYEGMYNRK